MTHTTESLMELRKLARDLIGFGNVCMNKLAQAGGVAIHELLDAITELVAERDALTARVEELEDAAIVQRGMLRLAHGERDTLRAQLAELQSGDELPELPKKARGFFCTKCGSGECKPGWEDEKNPPCGKCGYLGYASDLDYSTEQMQSYARQAQAMARSKLLAELGKVDCSSTGVCVRSGLYTRPLPAQAVNAHKPNCKECARWTQEQADNKEWQEGVKRGNEIVAALANAKAAQQKDSEA